MGKHVFREDEYGTIDNFAYSIGYHSGPECILCGAAKCDYCHREFRDEECPVDIWPAEDFADLLIDDEDPIDPNHPLARAAADMNKILVNNDTSLTAKTLYEKAGILWEKAQQMLKESDELNTQAEALEEKEKKDKDG